MSKAACKAAIDGAFILSIGETGKEDKDLGEALESPKGRAIVERIAVECRELGEFASNVLLAKPRDL